MANDDRDARPRRRSASARQLNYRSRRIATASAASADLDDITAGHTVAQTGSRPEISTDGAILNPNPDAASPGSVLNNFDSSFRILTIDGGGGRGMIPAVILEEVERRSGRRISSMFHRMCGTSTGAILACGLAAPEEAGSTTPRFRAREIVEIYRTLGAEIFSRGSFNDTVIEPMDELLALLDHTVGWFALHSSQVFDGIDKAKDVWERLNHPLHDVNKLAYVLHEHLGDLRLNDALTELFVYAYDIGSRTPEVLGSLDSSIPGTRAYSRVRMYQAATASSAAVPFFGPYRLWRQPDEPELGSILGIPVYLPPTGSGDDFDLVDGGNAGLGNPTLFALHEETERSAGQHKFVLSLGTGHFSEPITTDARGWGFLQWLGEGGELLKCMFDGESDVADMVMRQLDVTGDVTYFRWQPSIPESLAFLDEGSVDDMDALEDVARTFIAENDEVIDQVVELLTRPSLVLQSV